MKLHFSGKYDGNESNLPHKEHPKNYIPFKEIKDMKTFSRIMNVVCILVIFLTFIIIYLRTNSLNINLIGIILSFFCLFLHELLHALIFHEDVYLYYSLSSGLMFVVGTEDMSKTRYIIMSLFPNIILGFIPFTLFLINPNLSVLGTLGAICISMGVGDYYNIFLALTQMPKGSKTYLSGMHSYWYMP